MNTYNTSYGDRLSQRQIRSKYTLEKSGWMANYICEAYGVSEVAHDWDHTIAQARCKILHKTELIWDRQNVVRSSRKAHLEWESYKDGKFSYHKNAFDRMVFTYKHDPEGFTKRMFCITNEKLKKDLEGFR